MYRLITNKVRCKLCGDVIESRSRHDFRMCSCGKTGVDGGLDYTRRIFFSEDPDECYEEFSVFMDENGNLVKEVDQQKIPYHPTTQSQET